MAGVVEADSTEEGSISAFHDNSLPIFRNGVANYAEWRECHRAWVVEADNGSTEERRVVPVVRRIAVKILKVAKRWIKRVKGVLYCL